MESRQHKFLKQIIQIKLAREGFVVYPEIYTGWVNKTLDVVGVRLAGYPREKAQTIGVEVKVSRADFFGRKQKFVGAKGDGSDEQGLGVNFRYFFTPSGLIKKEELYNGWGLFEFRGGRVIRVVDAPQKKVNNDVVMYYLARASYNFYHQEKTGLMTPDFKWLTYGDLREKKLNKSEANNDDDKY